MTNLNNAEVRAEESVGGPQSKLKDVPLGSARWTKGFWADRFNLCHKTVIPAMREALEHPDNTACLSNLRVAAGIEKGEHRGTDWSDGDCYKWIEAMADVYAVTRDEELDREMDHWISIIAKAQDDDGYICTQVQLNPKKQRWGDRKYHELYNMGHLMTAASAHYRATGKESFVIVAKKLADYLYGLFQPRPPELAHFGWNPSNIMGLADLYRVIRDKRYLELAGIFVDMRGSAPGGDDQNQDRMPLRRETGAVGHAVTASYLYCGAADVYAETGETALFDALKRIWRNVVESKMYITGAIGAYHLGLSSRGDRVHEAFGRRYELPSRMAYNETCANIGNAMWNRRMLALTGEAKYADVMERVLYNSGISGVSVDGKRFFYTNPLARHGKDVPLLSNDSPERWFTFQCYCCPPQVARTLAKAHEWAYGISDDGLWVHLYGGSALEMDLPGRGKVKVVQETHYPWQGDVKIRFDETPNGDFSIMLRIPGWADNAEISINNQRAAVDAAPGTYAAIKRQWRAGDEISLRTPTRPRLIQSHPQVEETRGQVAVMRGPIVYCLESVDLPEGVQIHEVHIPRDINLAPRHDDDLLGGVTVLVGEARRIASGDWSGKLYQELPSTTGEPLEIRLIPYYAWCNRGVGEMRVWLPLV